MSEYGPLEDVEVITKKVDKSPGYHAWGTCPSCGIRGTLDEEQYRGEVSIDCPECDYHETHNHRDSP